MRRPGCAPVAPVELPRDGPRLMGCLAGRRLVFLGDSHVRNLFRCVADELTAGRARRAVGRPLPARNNASEPAEWPKYSRLEMASPPDSAEADDDDDAVGDGGDGDEDVHRLSCSNFAKIHRVDYEYSVESAGSAPALQLSFLWNPWAGESALLRTPAALAEWGADGAAYRFNYTGGRARGPLLQALRAEQPPPDLVITGGESRDHAALFRTFPSAAVLIDHAGLRDGLHAAAAAAGIPVADVSTALRARMPDFGAERAQGPHGTPRPSHPPEAVLRVQARLLLTLAAHQLCGASARAAAPEGPLSTTAGHSRRGRAYRAAP